MAQASINFLLSLFHCVLKSAHEIHSHGSLFVIFSRSFSRRCASGSRFNSNSNSNSQGDNCSRLAFLRSSRQLRNLVVLGAA